MEILIAGAGNVGRYLAVNLSHAHLVSAVDKSAEQLALVAAGGKVATFKGDATDPRKLEEAGVMKADIVVAVTGNDEDNLVIAQLAKQEYNVPKVIGRVNNPKNEWLFTGKWGVDVAVSSPGIILQLLTEELSLGEVITLLKLKVGQLSLIEITLPPDSPAKNRKVMDLGFPPNAVVVAVLRGSTVIVPYGATVIESGDSLIMVTRPDLEIRVREILIG